jgi:subtilisin-like proprotein convertase family protein
VNLHPIPAPKACRRYAFRTVLAACFALAGQAQIFIPDNSLVGVTSEITLSGFTAPIQEVRVTLTIQPPVGDLMVNGDYYVLLTHGSQVAVLLNRVGRRTGASGGYADSGFDITFSDAALADVHDYRLTLNGSHAIPLGTGDVPTGLTGTWQPDGRVEDPLVVLNTSLRSQTLSAFAGADPNGVWTLFVADVRSGGVGVLGSWDIEVTVVPEPSEWALGAGLGLVLWGMWRGRR